MLGRQQEVLLLQDHADLIELCLPDAVDSLPDAGLGELAAFNPLLQGDMHARMEEQTPVFEKHFAAGKSCQAFGIRPADEDDALRKFAVRLDLQLCRIR